MPRAPTARAALSTAATCGGGGAARGAIGEAAGGAAASLPRLYLPPDACSSCVKCGLQYRLPPVSTHQLFELSLLLHSVQVKHSLWKTLPCACARSAT